jgi:cytochrome b561
MQGWDEDGRWVNYRNFLIAFMLVTAFSIIYLGIHWIIAIPFFLFFNVGVTGNHIPAMQTIAYDLTPEIHNWFTRIAPVSSGMPSLHIGLPFAIWLTMQGWDEDGRWVNYRNFLIAFMLVTAFSIIYLGIHWIIAIPFFLFFNVGVTGNHIPAMQTIAYDLTPEIHNWFTRIDPFSNGKPMCRLGMPFEKGSIRVNQL